MRKSAWLYIPALLVVFSMQVSNCGKESDFREKYLGSWDFNVSTTYKFWQNHDKDTSYTLLFNGVINYGSAENELIIQYSESSHTNVIVEKDGKILNRCTGVPHYCGGEFLSADSLYYRNLSGDLGYSQREYIITGRRASGVSSLNKAPSAITIPASGCTLKGAKLNGKVVANYLSTDVSFEYGNSAKYGNPATGLINQVAGNDSIDISCYVTQLSPGTLYHFRVKAKNSMGTSYGRDMTFTTSVMTDPVTDIDGNKYGTVPVGEQVWMAENLRTVKYRNGDAIPTTSSILQDISGETNPKYQWVYEGNESYTATYGRLYTWYTVTDSRNICPAGWHVPSHSEMQKLRDDIDQYSGGILKEVGLAHWKSPNTGADNTSSFTALPGGERFVAPTTGGYLHISYFRKISGLSVRCIKD